MQPVLARRKSEEVDEACADVRLRADLVDGRDAARIVGAVDRQPGELAVVVGPVEPTPQIGVGEHLEQRTVLLRLGDEERVGEHRPQLGAVERRDHSRAAALPG
jgi:hypothetical protein